MPVLDIYARMSPTPYHFLSAPDPAPYTGPRSRRFWDPWRRVDPVEREREHAPPVRYFAALRPKSEGPSRRRFRAPQRREQRSWDEYMRANGFEPIEPLRLRMPVWAQPEREWLAEPLETPARVLRRQREARDAARERERNLTPPAYPIP